MQPYESRLALNLELMNEAMTIFIIDNILLYTDLMNEGSPSDNNPGNTPNLAASHEYSGWLFILMFSGTLAVHFIILGIEQVNITKARCKRQYLL